MKLSNGVEPTGGSQPVATKSLIARNRSHTRKRAPAGAIYASALAAEPRPRQHLTVQQFLAPLTAPRCPLLGSDRQSLTLRAGYAASRISSNLNGRTSKFGWLQARATIQIMQKLRTWRAIRFRPVVHTEVHNSDV